MSEQTEEKRGNGDGIPPEGLLHIRTLFNRLTEVILASCLTRRSVADALVAVGNWTSVMFASLIITVEERPSDSDARADKISASLNAEIKKHVVMLRGMKRRQKKEGSKIAAPEETTRE